MYKIPLHYRLGNALYRHAYPLYRPLYTGWKMLTERSELNWLRARVKTGDFVVDIGANVGFYVRHFARWVGPEGRVDAWEPDPRNYKHLSDTVSSLPQVKLFPCAASNVSGPLKLYISNEINVDHRIFPGEDERRSIEIEAKRLDDAYSHQNKIDLMMLDVQGAEAAVLKGMSRLLMEQPAMTLIIELWPYGLKLAGAAPEDMLSLLAKAGYANSLLVDGVLKSYLPELIQDEPNFYYTLVARKPDTV